MSKVVKNMLIDVIRDRLGQTRDLLVIDASRLDAVTSNRFRLAMQQKSISLLTVKNKLARRALEGAGLTALDPVLNGPSTLVWGGEDIIALSKEIARWARDLEPLQIKGGAVEGTTLDSAGVERLSRSPGRAELISQIVGLVLSPGARLAGALLGPGGKLSGQIQAIAENEEETAAA